MSGLSILVVEDDFLNRRLIKKTLTENKHQAFEAKSTAEALSVVAACKIDLLIIDINLGKSDLNGIQLGQQISTGYGIPFIYLTAYETKEIINQAVATLPICYLTKPFKKADLIAAIEMVVLNRHLQETTSTSLFLKMEGYNVKLPIKDINYIEADRNYLFIHSDTKTYRHRATIKSIISILPSRDFVQTHRAFIVNKEKVEMFSSNCLLVGTTMIPVSKKYVTNIQLVL